jgi:hypothetical protein
MNISEQRGKGINTNVERLGNSHTILKNRHMKTG